MANRRCTESVRRISSGACVLWVLTLMIGGCQSSPDSVPESVIATVGDRIITADEFRFNYELGFPGLKTGSDPRRAYLERMIDEKLLALEGYRLGLHERSEVRNKVQNLREELLVGQVFNKMVDRKVSVSDDEIEQFRNRDHVSFRLRYLPVSTRIQAARLREIIDNDGFDRALAEWEAGEDERRFQSSDFETGFISWSDVDPELLDAIVDLPVGSVSIPIPYRGNFIIIQVTDIQRMPLTAAPSASEKERYQQILFQKKAKRGARQFIQETMSSSGLHIKPGPYRRLEKYLWTWKQSHGRVENLFDSIERSDGRVADSIRVAFDETLMETRDERWTVARFLKEYPYTRYPFSMRSFDTFRSDLFDGFGLLLRDRVFLAMAESEGYGKLPSVIEEVNLWSDKWVYRQLVSGIRDTVSVSTAEMEAFFTHYRTYWLPDVEYGEIRSDLEGRVRQVKTNAIIGLYLRDLRNRYRITVNAEALARLDISDDAGSSASMVTILKGSTGRPAWPVVDPGR